MIAPPHQLTASDGYHLSAQLFKASAPSKRLVIIVSATGVPMPYYSKYAAYLAETGLFNVLTFDYRGIGESLHGPIKNFDAKMSDWGRLDLQAALAWGFDNYEKVFVIGHSVAGQVLPLAELSPRITAVWFVGSQCAANHLWDGVYRFLVNFFWKVSLPLSSNALGYMPGIVVGGGPPLPKDAALEWRSWGLHPQGIWKDDKAVKEKFEALTIPIHFVGVNDDHMMAPPRAVKFLQTQYSNAQTTHQQLNPSDFGLKEIGHFGFFRSRFKDKLWHLPVDFFQPYL
ncbi:MAG: alpha/beta fold hydrolase [Imperialibacter sp.]|uniref:alpha/beta hydrolase family protein n=1 Tax=Imperialibacter sp. TaxID=2038411 RepID=UPI0032EAEF3F